MKKWIISVVIFVLILVNGSVLFLFNQKIKKMEKLIVSMAINANKPNLSQITIQGESLIFRNNSGLKIAEILDIPNGGGLKIYNDKGKVIFDMYPWTNGGTFVINNNQGKMVSSLSSSDLGSTFILFDLLGKAKAGISTTPEGGSLLILDKDGKIKETYGK